MITGKNESRILAKDISSKCKSRSDGKNVTQINGGIMINVDKRVKNAMYVEKIIFGILLHLVAKIKNNY